MFNLLIVDAASGEVTSTEIDSLGQVGFDPDSTLYVTTYDLADGVWRVTRVERAVEPETV